MSSKSSKSKFIFALIVMIIGLLILNLSLNVDLSKLVSFALASNTKALRGGNQTEDCSKVVLLEECQNCLKYQLESPSKYPECQESGQRQKTDVKQLVKSFIQAVVLMKKESSGFFRSLRSSWVFYQVQLCGAGRDTLMNMYLAKLGNK